MRFFIKKEMEKIEISKTKFYRMREEILKDIKTGEEYFVSYMKDYFFGEDGYTYSIDHVIAESPFELQKYSVDVQRCWIILNDFKKISLIAFIKKYKKVISDPTYVFNPIHFMKHEYKDIYTEIFKYFVEREIELCIDELNEGSELRYKEDIYIFKK